MINDTFINIKVILNIMETKPKETRTQRTIGFTPTEENRIKAVADASGETFSGYIRRQILMIVSEEESQS